MMKRFLVYLLILCMISSMALAEPVKKLESRVLLSFEAENRFTVTASSGALDVESPWGEMVRFSTRTHADASLTIAFGRVSYRIWSDGSARLETEGQTVASEDLYDHLVVAGLEAASSEFWQGFSDASVELAGSDVLVSDGCGGLGIQCFWALLGAVGSVAALIAICGGTAGAGCIPALIAHVAMSGGAAGTCGLFLSCLDRRDDDTGHEGPRSMPAQG